MTTILLCWYALGWVNMGIVFAYKPEIEPPDKLVLFLFSPILFILFLFFILFFIFGFSLFAGKYIDKYGAPQYLWRKP